MIPKENIVLKVFFTDYDTIIVIIYLFFIRLCTQFFYQTRTEIQYCIAFDIAFITIFWWTMIFHFNGKWVSDLCGIGAIVRQKVNFEFLCCVHRKWPKWPSTVGELSPTNKGKKNHILNGSSHLSYMRFVFYGLCRRRNTECKGVKIIFSW